MKEPRDMTYQETLEYFHKIAKLMETDLTEEDLIGLQDWAVRGYDDGEFPVTKGRILRLIREVRELRELCNKAVVCGVCGNKPELFIEGNPFCKKCWDLVDQANKRQRYSAVRKFRLDELE